MRLLALAAAIALAACQWDPPAQGARDLSTPPLETSGYGAVHIGMTLAEARAASGQALDQNVADEDSAACQEQPFTLAGGDKLYLMFEEGRLTRITATDEAAHVRTAQNVGVGSTDEEVRTAYSGVTEQPAKYEDAPAHDLIAWTTPDQSGLRFEIGAEGRVKAVHAGGPSILYVEGCA